MSLEKIVLDYFKKNNLCCYSNSSSSNSSNSNKDIKINENDLNRLKLTDLKNIIRQYKLESNRNDIILSQSKEVLANFLKVNLEDSKIYVKSQINTNRNNINTSSSISSSSTTSSSTSSYNSVNNYSNPLHNNRIVDPNIYVREREKRKIEENQLIDQKKLKHTNSSHNNKDNSHEDESRVGRMSSINSQVNMSSIQKKPSLPSLPPNSQPPTLFQMLMLNPLNRNVVADLRLSSFKENEIIDAINTTYSSPTSILDYDDLMLAILQKAEPVIPTPEFDQESFNRDLDMAILNSESERENIQDRKRLRRTLLHTDSTILISTSEEFRGSALLGRRKLFDVNSTVNDSNNKDGSIETQNKRKLDEGSQLLIYLIKRLESDESKSLSNQSHDNNNNESHNITTTTTTITTTTPTTTTPTHTTTSSTLHRSHSEPINSISNLMNDPINKIKCNCTFQSSINQEKIDDHINNDNKNNSIDSLLHCCTCNCENCILPTPILVELRDLIVKLLFLEFDSYKWYSDAPIPYFLLFASRFDKLLDSTLLESELTELITPINTIITLTTTFNGCSSTKYIYKLITKHIFATLKVEIEALTRILLYFPSGSAGSIPEEFRRVDPEGMGKKWQIKEYDLDDDGIVIID